MKRMLILATFALASAPVYATTTAKELAAECNHANDIGETATTYAGIAACFSFLQGWITAMNGAFIRSSTWPMHP